MKTNMSHLLLVGILVTAIFASSSLVILQPSSMPSQSAFATFPGENGKIAFVSDRDRGVIFEIYVMNADGSDPTRLTDNTAFDGEPDWSPDGTKIAFSSGRSGGTQIYVMNADGSDPTRLTNIGFENFQPSWSPDGTKIAFTSTRDGNNEIYVIDADGTGQTRLTNNAAFDTFPSWSPDGTKIAFTSTRDGNNEIYVMNADGSDPTRLTNNAATDEKPDWSPDGTKIAFYSGRNIVNNENYEIYVMNADGSDPTRLTDNTVSDIYPSWSPDGTKITFWGGSGPSNEIYVMNADGSDPTRLTNNAAQDVSPDWGASGASPPPPDTTAPVLTVPDDIIVEATDPDGATVSFEVSAIDDIDGPVDVTCDYNSGDTFPIGETVVTCSAEDAAGNSAEETFTITVQDTTNPDVEITQVVDRRNRVLADGDTTPTPYIRVTFEATDAVGVENTECSLDGQGFTSCTSPVVYDRLSRGTHQVTVRATDEAGNSGEDQFLFTVGNPSAAAPGRQ